MPSPFLPTASAHAVSVVVSPSAAVAAAAAIAASAAIAAATATATAPTAASVIVVAARASSRPRAAGVVRVLGLVARAAHVLARLATALRPVLGPPAPLRPGPPPGHGASPLGPIAALRAVSPLRNGTPVLAPVRRRLGRGGARLGPVVGTGHRHAARANPRGQRCATQGRHQQPPSVAIHHPAS